MFTAHFDLFHFYCPFVSLHHILISFVYTWTTIIREGTVKAQNPYYVYDSTGLNAHTLSIGPHGMKIPTLDQR